MEIDINVILCIKKLRQFPNRQPVAHGQREIGHEAGLLCVQHRPFNDFSGQWVGPVQYIKLYSAFRGLFHAIAHRACIRIKSNSGILHIEHQRINSLQHIVGVPQVFAVKAIDR